MTHLGYITIDNLARRRRYFSFDDLLALQIGAGYSIGAKSIVGMVFSVVALFLISGQSGIAADYTYVGFIGPTLPQNVDDRDNDNSAARIAFHDNAATIYIARNFPNSILYIGRLTAENADVL